MRKILLTVFAVLLTAWAYTQNASAEKNQDLKKIMRAPVSTETQLVIQPADNGIPFNQGFPDYLLKSRAGGTTIGITTYGLGSNGSASDRLWVYETGEVSAVFTGSEETGATGYTDRGTFYNHYDGTMWGAFPDTRVEGYRTGFPQMTNMGGIAGVEMFVAHNGTNQLALFTSPAGTDTWTELPTSLSLTGTWSRIASSGTYVYILSADFDDAGTHMLYHRSPDGGLTWDIMNSYLPGIEDLSLYARMGAESYKIEAQGNNVWVVQGESINDLAVWKSEDNGSTWARTRIIEFPIPGYNDVISDVNGDGIADTITTQDGNVTLLVDDAGMTHVWCGATWIIDETVGDGGWSYFPGVTGMWYWNETFGPDSVQYLDLWVDWDEDGDPFLGIGASLPNYGCGMTSQPSAALDPATGNIYVTYTQMIENTDWFDDPLDPGAQSFRDIFGIYTTDGGMSWNPPINITYVAHDNYENLYPTTSPSTTGNQVHVLWMQDQEPGNEFEGAGADPIVVNDIIYRGFEFSRFDPYPPTAEYEYTGTEALVNFTNLSVDADEYEWDFGDGASASTKNTSHVYADPGMYNVCLTAFNKYDDDNTCKIIEVVFDDAVVNQALQQAVKVYPSPASTYIQIQVEGNFGQLFAEVYNSIGEKVIGASDFHSNHIEFDVTGLAAGNYVVKVYDSNGKYAATQISIGK